MIRRLILWADQLNTFFLSLKSYIFSFFSPSYFVCSSKPTSVWWWKLPSSTKLQFSFSIFCLHWWKKSNLQIDVPKLWMPEFQWKTNLFLENLVSSKQLEKSLKKNRFILFFDDVAIIVYFTSIEASSGFLLWFDDFSNISRLVIEFF